MKWSFRYCITIQFFIFITAIVNGQDAGSIEFVENKGQWDSKIKYKGDVSNGAFFIRNGGFTILQHNPEDYKKLQALLHPLHDSTNTAAKVSNTLELRSHAWDVDFVGAEKTMQPIPEKMAHGYCNYFIGNDPSKWAGNCRIFRAVNFQNIYPGIDVRYYTDNGMLKYDIIVAPGADPGQIALKYKGVDNISVKNKELAIATSIGERRESSPFTYQPGLRARQEINCKYVIKDNIVRFQIKNYDKTKPLIIDPTLVFCSFSGSAANNWGYTATYGRDGSMFGGGLVFSNGFPTSTGAFQTTYQGGIIDIGIIKLLPDGSDRVYATYIGGSGDEQPHSLIVDREGNLVLAGRSSSTNYPVTNTGETGLAGSKFDIVITKLNASGSALIGSKKIGGALDDGVNINPNKNIEISLQTNYGDDGRSEVILDAAGNVYVASCTQSNTFPVTAGAFQTQFGGGLQDGVVLKFDPNISTRLFASYLGGSGNDAAYVLSLNPSGQIYVAGGTSSTDLLPGTQAGTIGITNHGGSNPIDGFVAIIANDGNSVIRSTYIGTDRLDQIYGIQFDRKGFPYITGQTRGNWPKVPATIRTFGSSNGRQFICKLHPDLSAYVYSTVFGTNGSSYSNISPTAFLVDRCENVYVSGWGGESYDYESAGTIGLPITSDAWQSSTDGHDFYFFVLEKDAAKQLYGSFFGQRGATIDHVDGGTSRFDPNGVIYQGVCACSDGFHPYPTTPGAWATNKPPSANCNIAMIKMRMDLAGVGSDAQSAIGGVPRDTAGCIPLTVQFTDLIRNATSYIWSFGDGTPQTPELPAAIGYTLSHTYMSLGIFPVMLIAINPSTCNGRDTSYLNIKVGSLEALPIINYRKVGDCMSVQYKFNNNGYEPPSRPFSDTSFIWNFGDGSPEVKNNGDPFTHTFPGPGTYAVVLQLVDTVYCNAPDTDTLLLTAIANVEANFVAPQKGCAPFTITFDNTSLAGVSWEWDFGDGSPGSTDFEPTHTFVDPGTYTIRLIATDSNTCNIIDTTTAMLQVFPAPTAAFTVSPIVAEINKPHFFTNQSSPDAVRFKWLFGDGDSLETISRAEVEYQYNATGTYNACLIAYNIADCPDTACIQVSAQIDPLIDMPNAFTPNSGDVNSRIFVRGFGIATMKFTIWNRWGQKVFETANRHTGWDGKVKGKLQPMDVYAYTLEVVFVDGTKARKTGDITLIR